MEVLPVQRSLRRNLPYVFGNGGCNHGIPLVYVKRVLNISRSNTSARIRRWMHFHVRGSPLGFDATLIGGLELLSPRYHWQCDTASHRRYLLPSLRRHSHPGADRITFQFAIAFFPWLKLFLLGDEFPPATVEYCNSIPFRRAVLVDRIVLSSSIYGISRSRQFCKGCAEKAHSIFPIHFDQRFANQINPIPTPRVTVPPEANFGRRCNLIKMPTKLHFLGVYFFFSNHRPSLSPSSLVTDRWQMCLSVLPPVRSSMSFNYQNQLCANSVPRQKTTQLGCVSFCLTKPLSVSIHLRDGYAHLSLSHTLYFPLIFPRSSDLLIFHPLSMRFVYLPDVGPMTQFTTRVEYSPMILRATPGVRKYKNATVIVHPNSSR